MSTAVVWFRRDLRLHDHPALSSAVGEFEHIVPAFVLDEALLRGRFASAARTTFMLGCLRALDEELRQRGSRLVIRRGPPEQAITDLALAAGAAAVFWTSDVSPYARARDARVTEALRVAGVQARAHGGNYVIDIAKPRTQDDGAYHVFSPFFRRWRSLERRPVHGAPRKLRPVPSEIAGEDLPHSIVDLGLAAAGVAEPIAAPGEPAARQALEQWLADGLARYADRQNGMGRLGTSRLSPYLRWGCLSPRELEHRALTESGGKGAEAWVRQLGWRDFYAHVLLAWPQNTRLEFQPRLRGLEWEPPGENLDAWQEGQTGYPIVDAGMRQLARTGWMHNRARLIVGSFLTKDLHLDWREGERWFERLLLDGEPAQNNGNWQWIASVGTDPAPAYRRMYNPTLQAQRFDPGGAYIRRWVPELERVPDEKLFEPWTMSEREQRAAGCVISRDYPAPVVQHKVQRRRALERYRAAAA